MSCRKGGLLLCDVCSLVSLFEFHDVQFMLNGDNEFLSFAQTNLHRPVYAQHKMDSEF